MPQPVPRSSARSHRMPAREVPEQRGRGRDAEHVLVAAAVLQIRREDRVPRRHQPDEWPHLRAVLDEAQRDGVRDVDDALRVGARHRQLEQEERDQDGERIGRVELGERRRPLPRLRHVALLPERSLEAGRVVGRRGQRRTEPSDRRCVSPEHGTDYRSGRSPIQ